MNKKILIIDDDRDLVAMFTRRLASEGYEVLTSYDSLHAVRTAFEEKPDLIILDIKMPGGGGISVFERLRLINTTSIIPVIFLTAETDEKIKSQVMAKGAKGYITKPFDGEDVLKKIKEIIF